MRIVVVLLAAALAASIATGLLGLWPELRSGNSASDRREKARISRALARASGSRFAAQRVRLDYLPGRALVEEQILSTGRRFCVLVAEDFGSRVDQGDVSQDACDF